jgi:MFS family permease
VLLAGQFIANVDTAIVNVATPSFRANLHASGAELQLIVAGYTLAYAMLLITGARLGEMRGYSRIFLVGLGGFTVASLACGLAPDARALIAARVVQGASAAMMVPQVLSGIQRTFSGTARARAFGLYALALSSGAAAGQILAGVLISANIFGAQWRPIFLINVPIGIALFAVALRVLPADRGTGRGLLDVAGVMALSLAVLLAIVPLVLGREMQWPTWAWLSLAASIPAAALFVGVERRVAIAGGYPLIDLAIFKRRGVAWGLLALAAPSSTYFALLFVLALYLQQGLGKSPLYSGFALVSWVAAFGVAGPLLPRIPRRFTPFVVPIGDIVLMIAYIGIAVLALVAGRADGVALFALLGLGGLGLGIQFSGVITHLTGLVETRHAADLSGLITTTSQVAAVVGVAAFGGLYLGLGSIPMRHPATTAFATVAACLSAAALVALVAALQSSAQSAKIEARARLDVA